jgi:hypothetical protein
VDASVTTALSSLDIIGTWRVVRTEIPPPYNPEHEFFHFSPDGGFAWEYPFLAQSLRVFRFRYTTTQSGVRFTNPDGEHLRDLPMHFEGELLVITGPHGYSSRLHRIPAAARPSYLSVFYERPENTRDG